MCTAFKWLTYFIEKFLFYISIPRSVFTMHQSECCIFPKPLLRNSIINVICDTARGSQQILKRKCCLVMLGQTDWCCELFLLDLLRSVCMWKRHLLLYEGNVIWIYFYNQVYDERNNNNLMKTWLIVSIGKFIATTDGNICSIGYVSSTKQVFRFIDFLFWKLCCLFTGTLRV